MPTYTQSFDRLFPAGTSMQEGDWVVTKRMARDCVGTVAAIADIINDHLRLDRPEGVPRELSEFGGSLLGEFHTTNIVLLHRPQPARTPPNLRGDYFKPGDLIQVGDNTAPALLRVVVAHSLFTQPWLVQSDPWCQASGQRQSYSAHYCKLVWREGDPRFPASPPVERYVPPCEVGMANEWPALEFAKGVSEWMVANMGKTCEEAGVVFDQPPTAVLSRHNMMGLLARFMAGTCEHTSTNSTISGQLVAAADACDSDNDQEIYTAVCMALIRLFNMYSSPNSRCGSCLVEGRKAITPGGYWRAGPRGCTEEQERAARAMLGVEPCPHIPCDSCGAVSALCTVCSDNSLLMNAFRARNTCLRCCDHVTCNCGAETCHKDSRRGGECTCGKVGRCCTCPSCERCGSGVQQDCCGRCRNCCACREQCMPNIPGEVGSHTMMPLHKFVPHRRERGFTRLLGAEIETAGCERFSPKLRAAVKKWQCSIIDDGSLAEHDHPISGYHQSGMELVTQPAGGSLWPQMIADLGDGFAESKAFTDDTCGLHIHVDASDVGVYELSRLIRLYAHIEPALYDAISAERDDNEFSSRCGEKLLKALSEVGKLGRLSKATLGYVHYGLHTKFRDGAQMWDADTQRYVTVGRPGTAKILATLRKKHLDNIREDKYNNTRYVGLNLHSYWYRGTVEFRHHHGTNDPEKIRNWGIFVGNIVDFAVKKPEAVLKKMLELKPREAALAIQTDDAVKAWIQTRWARFTLPTLDLDGTFERRRVRRNSETGET